MTPRITAFAVSLLCAALAVPAFAHDPKEHEKEAAAAKAAPDCAKLKTMDMSKMDPNDPVMKAMQAKCDKAKAAHPEPKAHSDKHGDATPPKKDGDGDAHGGH